LGAGGKQSGYLVTGPVLPNQGDHDQSGGMAGTCWLIGYSLKVPKRTAILVIAPIIVTLARPMVSVFFFLFQIVAVTPWVLVGDQKVPKALKL